MPTIAGRPCKIWTGAKSGNGYGYRRHEGRVRRVHVLAYEEAHGPVPEGHEVHHRCEIPACHELAHLEALPVSDHRRRHSKITAEIAKQIRESTERPIELARRFKISRQYVTNIRAGRRWA